MQKIFFLFMLFSVTCLFAESDKGRIETLKGFLFHEQGAQFNVPSYGCTKKEDFVLIGNSKCEISLLRIRQDGCESRRPFGTLIFFEKKEIENAVRNYHCSSIKFTNPISSTMPLLEDNGME